MSDAFDLRIEWLDAPGVTAPELAATWARYELWINDRCVTQVETADGTLRRSVYGSLYPLAEWIAENWWILLYHIRPTAVETRYWTWSNVRNYPWLAQHNLRAAGDGMAWPNLTLVVDGAVTQMRWTADNIYARRPIRFASDGVTFARIGEVREGLASIVARILERLSEQGLAKTTLADEWDAIARTGDEEAEFCMTAAKLGLDPYSVTDEIVSDIFDVASKLPDDLLPDFFDSADSSALPAAAQWTRRAITSAARASDKTTESLSRLYSVLEAHTVESPARDGAEEIDRPWLLGYDMARRVRSELSISPTANFDTSPWVGLSELSAPSKGVQGVAAVNNERCGLVLGLPQAWSSASRFGQARALGRILSHPRQNQFVLSLARGHDERVARAFAAELLAPADGIRQFLGAIGKSDDTAIEAVARRYRVSPLLVRHQYDNQIAKTVDSFWL